MKIPFNKPYITGNEIDYIKEDMYSGHISGNGIFTKKCQNLFEKKYHISKALRTTSCTDALEMSTMLIDIKEGDEVIIPSYTFVSTAIAFVRQGAKIVFCDSLYLNPNINDDKIEELISSKTKAIVVVHYAGVAGNMGKIMALANKYNLFVIEDAAQAIDLYYNNKPLGSIGHLGCFSFHETKNIQCGEGGLLTINDPIFNRRSEIIWEKGTNRAEFFRGEINKYGWVDIGSSFLPSDISAAFLLAQLEQIDTIQKIRNELHAYYHLKLGSLQNKGCFSLPLLPDYATNNAHMCYIICNNLIDRTNLINELKKENILAVFHYQSLHKSEYYKEKHDGRVLLNADKFTDCLLRLPLYFELSLEQIDRICKVIYRFYSKNTNA